MKRINVLVILHQPTTQPTNQPINQMNPSQTAHYYLKTSLGFKCCCSLFYNKKHGVPTTNYLTKIPAFYGEVRGSLEEQLGEGE